MRADQLLSETYEYCRSETASKGRTEGFQEGMRWCMVKLSAINMVVKSHQEVDVDLLELLIRHLRRRLGAGYENVMKHVETKMREVYEKGESEYGKDAIISTRRRKSVGKEL